MRTRSRAGSWEASEEAKRIEDLTRRKRIMASRAIIPKIMKEFYTWFGHGEHLWSPFL